jgi:asparagine synthase (glutamine-hydrolysing)
MFGETQDVRVARRVAQACEQPHQTIPIERDFLSRFSHYAERSVRLTDGCVDVSRAPDLFVSEKAREFAPVKIVGTYGSEVLSLTPAFKPVQPVDGLFDPALLDEVRQAGATYAELRRGDATTFAAFRQSPWWHYGILALEQTQLTVRSPYLDNAFIRTVYRAPASAGADRDVRLRLIGDGNPALATIPTDRGVGGDSGPLSTAVARALLGFTLKAEYAYDYSMPQWLARIDHLCSPFHLERLFLGRHKMLHFRVWYRDALANYVREMLLDARTLARPYLQRNAVEAIVRGHLKGDGNYTREIHKLLTLELVHRLFFDAR